MELFVLKTLTKQDEIKMKLKSSSYTFFAAAYI